MFRVRQFDADALLDPVEQCLDLHRIEFLGEVQVDIDEYRGGARVNRGEAIHGIDALRRKNGLVQAPQGAPRQRPAGDERAGLRHQHE